MGVLMRDLMDLDQHHRQQNRISTNFYILLFIIGHVVLDPRLVLLGTTSANQLSIVLALVSI